MALQRQSLPPQRQPELHHCSARATCGIITTVSNRPSRRTFLGLLATIPFISHFIPQLPKLTFSGEYCIDCLKIARWVPSIGILDVGVTSDPIPIVLGVVPRDWLKLPYYRARTMENMTNHTDLILVQSHNQDPEFHTSELSDRSKR